MKNVKCKLPLIMPIVFLICCCMAAVSLTGISASADEGGNSEQAKVTSVNMHTFHHNTSEGKVGFIIEFSEDICVSLSNNIVTQDWVSSSFMLNGSTFKEIHQSASASGYKFEVQVEKLNQLTVWVDDRIDPDNGGLKKDKDGGVSQNGNKVVIKKTVKFPTGVIFGYDEDISFVSSGGIWARQYSFSEIEQWDEVEVLSVSNPESYEDGKVRYEVTFSEEVATKRYIHINGGVDWIRSAHAAIGLDAEEVEKLNYYGILSSILDKIYVSVNGTERSVREWQELDTADNFPQGVFQIHYNQQNGLDTLQILWAGKRIPTGDKSGVASEIQPLCPPLDAAISITFKAGFRTPKYQEIKRDVTFTFSGNKGDTFVKQNQALNSSTVTFTKVLYNGEPITEGGTFTLQPGVTSMDKNLFTVLFEEGTIPYEIIGISKLSSGKNTVTIKGTTNNASAEFTFYVICEKASGCGSAINGVSATVAAIAILLCVGVILIRRKLA